MYYDYTAYPVRGGMFRVCILCIIVREGIDREEAFNNTLNSISHITNHYTLYLICLLNHLNLRRLTPKIKVF